MQRPSKPPGRAIGGAPAGVAMPFGSIVKHLWAAPATVIGLGLGACAVVAGGARFAMHSGVVEISLSQDSSRMRRISARLPFSAITFGHAVIAKNEQAQNTFRCHERVHVAQYERWGPLFLMAYPLESFRQLVRGRRPYFDNRFEVAARAAENGDCRI